MLIAHITDSHIEVPEPQGAGRIRDFERVVSHISALEKAPDFIVHTGDITHCNRVEEYEKVRQMLSSLTIPVLIIPGNKDERQLFRQFFGTRIDSQSGSMNYSVNAGAITLLMLDTLHGKSNKGYICEQRAQWIDAKLAAASGPVAIFMHHPTYDMPQAPHPFQFECRDSADRFNQIIASHENVAGVFCGHAHRNTSKIIDGVPAMTLTAMAIDRRRGDYPSEYTGKPVYQLIEFADDGSFEMEIQFCD